MTDYALDGALRDVVERLRKLELSVARNKPASGVTVGDSGGLFGSPDSLTLEQILALIGAATAPAGFLRTKLGELGDIHDYGTLGATEVIDLALANHHIVTLAEDCDLTITGWTPGKFAIITGELIQDGTGGWLPTITGVTWLNAAPTANAADEVQFFEVWSRDGGTTIWGLTSGADSSADAGGQTPYLIENGETFTVPVKKQALKAMPITIDSGGSLVVDGFLLEVA